MRVKRDKPKKLAIQKKQKEIAESVNTSELINENLRKDNEELLHEISYKKEQIIEIKKETQEFIDQRNKSKLDYEKSKFELDTLNVSIQEL
jgi:hypothetical protein